MPDSAVQPLPPKPHVKPIYPRTVAGPVPQRPSSRSRTTGRRIQYRCASGTVKIFCEWVFSFTESGRIFGATASTPAGTRRTLPVEPHPQNPRRVIPWHVHEEKSCHFRVDRKWSCHSNWISRRSPLTPCLPTQHALPRTNRTAGRPAHAYLLRTTRPRLARRRRITRTGSAPR